MRTAALALAACLAAGPAAAAISLTDDLGRRVELASPAQRIVTLAPSITEAAFAIGAGDRVVGVSAYSDFPPQASGLPVVSSATGIDFEALARLSPDLVIAWKDSFRPDDVARLEALGAKVYVARTRKLADIVPLLAVTAALAGADAGPATRAYESRLAQLRARYAGRTKLAVFLPISERPLMTVAGAHFMNEALAACGATNVFADLPDVAPLVSLEELYARNPQAIVGAGSRESAARFLKSWSERESLEAVRQGKVAYVESMALGRPSPRVVEGIEALCLALDRLR